MKNIVFAWGSMIVVLFSSCKKEEPLVSYASINVVNAAIGAGAIKVNYFGKPVTWSGYSGAIGDIAFATNQMLTLFSLNNDYPFTIVPVLDTLKPMFSEKLVMVPTGRYTLFAAGQAPSAYDAVFVKETNIPYGFSDSAISVRFINLSPNSPLVNITLASEPATKLQTDLTYKQLTAFKQFPLKKVVSAGSMTFEVRDAVSNLVLTSYTIPEKSVQPYPTVSTSLSRFKSVTLVIKGLAGTTSGVNAFSVFPAPQY